MDAFELMRRDHDKARALLEELLDGGGEGPDERARRFHQLDQELGVYLEIEESAFLPVFHKHGRGLDRVRAVREDHEVIRGLLGELERAPLTEPRWRAAAERLLASVERHARQVEQHLFPLARRLLDDNEIEALTRTMQSQRQTKFAKLTGADKAAEGRLSMRRPQSSPRGRGAP